MSIYFCGGSCVKDVTTHLMNHLSLHPTLRTCSSDTILRAIKELTQENYWFEFNLISAALWVSIFYKYLSNKSCSGFCHVFPLTPLYAGCMSGMLSASILLMFIAFSVSSVSIILLSKLEFYSRYFCLYAIRYTMRIYRQRNERHVSFPLLLQPLYARHEHCLTGGSPE